MYKRQKDIRANRKKERKYTTESFILCRAVSHPCFTQICGWIKTPRRNMMTNIFLSRVRGQSPWRRGRSLPRRSTPSSLKRRPRTTSASTISSRLVVLKHDATERMWIEAATNFYKIAILMEHIQLFQNIVVQIETLSGNMEAGEGKKSCTISWVFIFGWISWTENWWISWKQIVDLLHCNSPGDFNQITMFLVIWTKLLFLCIYNFCLVPIC